MGLKITSNMDPEMFYISQQILNWSRNSEKTLNVIAPPYSSPIIFFDSLIEMVLDNKKVLYITDEHSGNVKLINYIRKYSKFKKYSYVRNNSVFYDSNLLISSFENAKRLDESFDLIIYDDLNSFPKYDNDAILQLIQLLDRPNTKVLNFSIEAIFKKKRELILPVRNNRIPIIEPRIITTRLDINKELPYVIFDYLKWSMNQHKKVIIYAPDEEKVMNIYTYLINFKRDLSTDITFYIKDKGPLKDIFNFLLLKEGIMITNDFYNVVPNSKAIDVMVYFSDDKEFTYKRLVNFCARVGRVGKLGKEEVVFLARNESTHMDKARDIIRFFNKEAWENQLLRI